MTYSQPPAVPAEPARAGGLAITALVLSIIAQVLSPVLIGGLLAVVTLVLGIVAWAMAAGNPARTKGIPIAATVVSVAAVVLAIVAMIVFTLLVQPYWAKGQAVVPAFQTAAQSATAAEKAGANEKDVSAAMQTFTEQVGAAVRDAATADEAKQAADAALEQFEATVAGLPRKTAPDGRCRPTTSDRRDLRPAGRSVSSPP